MENLAENFSKLEEFGIEGRVEDSLPGPVITRFEISLAPGTKASQVSNIANDLARSLAVKSVRVVEVIDLQLELKYQTQKKSNNCIQAFMNTQKNH